MFYILDIETLGLKPSSVVASIAAMRVFPEKKPDFMDLADLRNHFFARLPLGEQQQKGRTIDASTVSWWMRQDGRAIDRSFDQNTYSYTKTGVNNLLNFLKDEKYGSKNPTIYTRGAFDQVIMTDLCEMLGTEQPTAYYMWRDIRTYLDVKVGNPKCEVEGHGYDPSVVVAHDPTWDIIMDAMRMLYGK